LQRDNDADVYVVYDSWSMNTATMAKAVAEGAQSVPGVKVELSKVDDVNVDKLESAKAVILGSPTHNRGVTSKMANLMEQMTSHSFKGKVGGAFGSYGWSGGEAIQSLKGMMKDLQMDMPDYEVRVMGAPKEDDLERSRMLGKEIAELVSKQGNK
jgi:flavorubredoxin